MLLINFDVGNVIRQNAKKKDICSAPNISTSTLVKCTFSSNKIVQKISFSFCFWASDHLIDKSN